MAENDYYWSMMARERARDADADASRRLMLALNRLENSNRAQPRVRKRQSAPGPEGRNGWGWLAAGKKCLTAIVRLGRMPGPPDETPIAGRPTVR